MRYQACKSRANTHEEDAEWETTTVKSTLEAEKLRTEGLYLLNAGFEELLAKTCAHFEQYDSHLEEKTLNYLMNETLRADARMTDLVEIDQW